MDEEQKSQTINEEAGLPDNWTPVDAPPIVPSAMAEIASSDASLKYLQGSLPPGFQHDTSFVGTAYKGHRTPQLSLMPLGNQGNPSTNAAAQSTSALTAAAAVIQATQANPPDVESIAVNTQAGTAYTVQSTDRNTLISLSNNAGGVVTLSGSSPAPGTFIQAVEFGINPGGSASTAIFNTARTFMSRQGGTGYINTTTLTL